MYSNRLFLLRDRLIISLLILLLALLSNPVMAQQFPILEITGQAIPLVKAGENVAVHLTLRNSSNAIAENVQLVVSLPTGILPIVNNIKPPLSSGQPLTWSFDTLLVGETVPLTLPVMIEDTVLSGNLQIEVSYVIDGGVASEPIFISLTVQTQPESSGTPFAEIVAQEIIPNTMEVGGEAELQFTLKNSGSATANNIQVQVILPAKINHVGDEQSVQLVKGEQIIWNFPKLQAGQSKNIQLSIKVDSDAVPGEYKVEISDTINGIASITKTIPLTVTERQGKPIIQFSAERVIPDKAEVGQDVTIQFTLKNSGDAPADNVKIEVSLPVGVTPTRKGGQPVLADGGTAVWEFAELPVDYEQSFILPVRVEDGAILGEHTVNISYSTEGAGSDGVSVVLELIAEAVPIIEVLNQRISPKEIELGEKAVVQFTLKNSSDFTARNIQIEAALPAGIVPLIDGSRPKFLLPSIGGIVIWELPEISGGKTIDFMLSVQVQPEVEITNYAINIAYGTADALTLNLAAPIPVIIINAPSQDNEYSFVLFGGALTIALLAGVVAVIAVIAGLFLLKRRDSSRKKSSPVTVPTQQKQQPLITQQETVPAVPTGSYLESSSRTVEPRYFTLDDISSNGFFIGRAMPAEGINLRIDNSFPGWETVSRKHAMLYYDTNTGDIVIRDNKSKNGLYVNGFRTAHNALKDGSTVTLGSVEFIYHQSDDGSTKPVGQLLGQKPKRSGGDK